MNNKILDNRISNLETKVAEVIRDLEKLNKEILIKMSEEKLVETVDTEAVKSEAIKSERARIASIRSLAVGVNGSDEVVEKEKSIQLEIMKNDPKMAGKSDEVLLKIIDGKIGKFKSEISLLEQAFVVNPDVKVKDFIGVNTLSAFYRFSI